MPTWPPFGCKAILLSGRLASGGSINENTCFYVMYRNNRVGIATAMPKPISGSTCVKPSPPVVQCEIVSGDITLDHGTVNSTELNGNKVSKNVEIFCSRSASVRFYVKGTASNTAIVDLNAGGTLMSTLKVNGKVGDTGDIITTQENGRGVLSVPSELIGDNVIHGVFVGLGVAYLDVI